MAILRYFGFKGVERIKNRDFNYNEFHNLFPSIDIEKLERDNKFETFFYEDEDLKLCFISDKLPLNKINAYKISTNNKLVRVDIYGVNCLVELDDVYNIINIYRIKGRDVIKPYYICRGMTKIESEWLSLKKLKNFLKARLGIQEVLYFE